MEKIANIEFDLPDFLTNNNMSSEEFEAILVSFTQKIVDRRFPNDIQKRKIRIHKNKRISFSCPYCGDSMQNSWKQRGNIILEGKHKYYLKCFNCGEFKRVDQFFKDFKIDLSLDVISYISDNKGDFYTSVGGRYDISLLLDVSTIEGYAIDRQELKTKFDLIEANESSVWSWLNKRLQFDAKKFLYSVVGNYLLILNLTPSGKILGFQKRPFQTFKGSSRFLTYSLTGIYELLKKEEKVPDEIDTLSQLFDICTINFNQPIILLEGPLDSFLVPNSIANGGANKHFPIDLPLKYLYDRDTTGIKKSVEHINKGDEVFLWEKFLRDINAPYRKKWDINDIYIWAKENNIRLPYILNYFSKGPLDIIDI